MKIIGYARVSTKTQVREGLGLAEQRRMLKEWARANGHKLVRVITDDGVSGSNGIETRYGLAEALDAIRPRAGKREAEGIVVPRLDRLARDLVLQEQLIRDIRARGGEIFTAAAGEAGYLADDPNDPSRALIRQVLGAVAQYEKAMISLRLKRGKDLRIKEGKRGGGGKAPFGFRSVDANLQPVPDELAIIKQMMRLRKKGLSLRAIGRELDKRELKPRSGGKWDPTSLSEIIAREELRPGRHRMSRAHPR